jgi:hypothetical protein
MRLFWLPARTGYIHIIPVFTLLSRGKLIFKLLKNVNLGEVEFLGSIEGGKVAFQ